MKISKEIGESLTLKFAETARELSRQGRDIISLGLGEPDFNTPEYIVDETYKAIKDGYTKYSSSMGLFELRKHISEDINSNWNFNISPNEVIIFPGVKSAIYMSLCSILEPSDEVIVISPYYVSYPAMIKLAEPTAKIIDVPLSRNFNFDLELFKSKITPRTKCVILNFPQNPTGTILNESTLREIANVCYNNKTYIISDEVYEKLTFNKNGFISCAKFNEYKEYIIIANGYSKSYAMTGWRIGYAIVPNKLVKTLMKMNQHINTNTCTFIQKAVCSVYKNHDFHLKDYIPKLIERFDYFESCFLENDKFKIIKPTAGFFCFVNIRGTNMDSNTFCSKLLEETGVATTPGIAFGKEWDDYIRVSLATNSDTLKKGITLIQKFLKRC